MTYARSLFITMGILVAASPAWAQDTVPGPEPAPSVEEAPAVKVTTTTTANAAAMPIIKERLPQLEIGIGIKGGMNGSWVTEVPEDSRYTDSNGQQFVVDPDFYPMFGLGGDVGLAVDIRAWSIVGIETGVRLSYDNGRGWNDKKLTGSDTVITRVVQEQSTQSLRIPLLLKLSASSGLVRPFFGVGAEFVRQRESTLVYSEEKRAGQLGAGELEKLQARNLIETTNYTTIGATLGLEINLDFIRIPIEFRGLYNLDYDESFEKRVRVEESNGDTTFVYNGQSQGHFGFSIGILYNHTLLQ